MGMRVLSSGSDNDLFLGADGQIAMASGREAYAQCAAALFRTIRGEHYLDVGLGVPHVSMMSGASSGSEWRTAMKEAALSLPFVRSVRKFESKYVASKKAMEYSMTMETDAGSVTVAG